MRVYQCDSCKRIIENPYIEKMKEFDLGTNLFGERDIDIKYKRRVKIHLCEKCYYGLKSIANSKIQEEKQ